MSINDLSMAFTFQSAIHTISLAWSFRRRTVGFKYETVNRVRLLAIAKFSIL